MSIVTPLQAPAQGRASCARHSPLPRVLLALLLLAAGQASALPEAEGLGLVPVGQGKLTWFRLPIYTAELWASPDSTRASLDRHPRLLALTYARDIEAARIVKTTAQEWERLDGRLDARKQEWLVALQRIIPDVRKGDRIACYVDARGHAVFFKNGSEIGRVEDGEFGARFLAIWLDPETREPRVREQLLRGLPA